MYCSLHGRAPSFACDMWSYMCIFAVIYIGPTPFVSMGKDGVMAFMVETLGPPLEQWKGSYDDAEEGRDTWYDPDTKLKPEGTLAANIERMRPERNPVEKQHVLSILTRGFSYCPEERPTATQLLRDGSVRATMDKYSC